ncbi:MAG: TIM barrel protein [Cytophagales bacterium]|nr:TIM barrel protein [Cytophagales bacterium]
MIQLGIKTDPITTRYSFEWLFDLLREEEIKYVQLGAFFEMFHMDDDSYFVELREKAESRGLRIKSMFSAYREFGGFFYDHPQMERAARRMYERYIHIAAVLGLDYAGTNPGAVYRDQMYKKEQGIETYLHHMRELQELARQKGLKALTIEPMSCLAEPPTTPQEMDYMIGSLNAHHQQHPESTVPVWLCGDVSHGLADANKQVVHSPMELFRHGIPMMCEFHFKNTDSVFGSTFGFGPEERQRGIVSLEEVKQECERQADRWPVSQVVGYLEIGGPKIGRDYSDPLLGATLRESLRAIKEVFDTADMKL